MNDASPVQVGGIAADKLQSYFDKIERLTETRSETQAEIKGVFDEAKSEGFDPKIMRAVLRLRKLSEPDRQEMDSLMDLYRHATGT